VVRAKSAAHVTGDHEDRALAARFALDGVARSWRGALLFCAFAAALLVFSAVFSRFAEPATFSTLLVIRAGTLAAIAVSAWALTTAVGRRRARELAIVLAVTMTVCLHELAQATGGQLSPQYDRLTLVLLAPAILMSWNGWWSAAACVAVIATYVTSAAAVGQLHDPNVAGHVGRLLAVGAVTVGANLLRERQRWRELVQVWTLTAARERAEGDLRRLNEELEQRVLERTAALGASEARFRAMFEAAPIGVLTVDAAGIVLQANRSFAAMLGRAASRLVAASLVELVEREDRDALRTGLAAQRAGSREAQRVELHLRRSAGGAVIAQGALAAIRDAAGTFVCALVMLEDVTERLQSEQQARDHQEQLAHVLRMASMGGMVAELAHELNQPLGAIVNFANGSSVRLRQTGADPAIAAAVACIAAEGMRAAEILRRVREFVRPGGVPTADVDANAVVREAVHLVASEAARHDIQVHLRLADGLPPMTLDRIHVEQVLLNLLHNAIDAMRDAPAGEHVLLVETVARGSGEVEVRVGDTGIGVPDDAADRIFEAFYTTKSSGLGMGLSISRSIVEAHGGRLWARRNAARGMTFAFTLLDDLSEFGHAAAAS
jgi:PAS domain S-box-containing protein